MNSLFLSRMSRFATALGLIAFTPWFLVCAEAAQAEKSKPFRSAWIHLNALYEATDDIPDREASMGRALDDCKRAGLDSIIPFALTSSGVSQYRSDIVPQNQFEDWDPLGALIGEARDRDLGVYIAVPVLVCGHDEPSGILVEHPEWAVRDENGAPLGYICGGNLEARKWVVSVIEELVRKYQPEGVILDYLRFPNKPVDVDPTTREGFLKEARIDSYELTQREGPWQGFKEGCLIELAGQIREGVERVKPGTTIGIYTWGPHVASNHYVSQNWVTMTRKGYLDLINVSGYLDRKKNGEAFLEKFEEKMAEALSLLDGVDRSIDFAFVLGVITSHGELHSAEEIEQYLEAADRAGMKGISVFTLTYLQPYIDDLLDRGHWTRFLNAHVGE